MQNFYIDLPSNTRAVAKEYVRENTSSEFRVRLPEEIRLGSEPWEVALVELQYPHSWYNITTEKYITPESGAKKTVWQYNRFAVKTKTADVQHYHVSEGYYERVENLIDAMAIELAKKRKGFDVGKHFKLHYDPILKMIGISTTAEVTYFTLSRQLNYVLGYKKYVLGPVKDGDQMTWHMADYPPDMSAGISSLYVYCDIVAPQIVGNVHAPLLRIVPVTGTNGDIVDRAFTTPHYVPVLNKQFSTIGMSIYTDQYKPFNFKFGKTIAKLHFRRRHLIRR